MKSAAALFACLLALAAPVFAQETPTDPNDPKIVLATKILEEAHSLDNMSSVLDIMIPALTASIKRQSPTLTDDQLKTITDMLETEMKARLPKMLVAHARIYAAHYTLDELKALDAFYQTPAGQKVIAENPKIMKEAVPLGMAWGKESAAEAMEKVVAKLRKDGVKI